MLSNTSNSCNKMASGRGGQPTPPTPTPKHHPTHAEQKGGERRRRKRSEEAEWGEKNGDATTRTPTLPSRKSGSFPPRYAQRAKPAGSIHEPPRNIRARSPSNSSRPSFGSYG